VDLKTPVAVAHIEAAGLVPVLNTHQGSAFVFSQTPKGGATVTRGSTVNLVLHSGPSS
jgi:beta-lactam-binding protein with PASTA domain